MSDNQKSRNLEEPAGKLYRRVAYGIGLVLLALVSWPIYYPIKNGYGDLLYLESFFVDLFQHGGKWTSWAFTASPAFLPDVLAYGVAFVTFDYITDRIFFVSLVQIALIVLSAEALFAAMDIRNRANASFIFLMLVAVISYCSYTTGMWMYFNATNNHIGSFIFGVFGLASLMGCLRHGTVQQFLILGFVSLVAIVSGPVFVITFMTTAFLASLLHLLWFRALGVQTLTRGRNLAVILTLTSAFLVSGPLESLVNPFARDFALAPVPQMERSARLLIDATLDLLRFDHFLFSVLTLLWVVGYGLTAFWFLKLLSTSYLNLSLPSPRTSVTARSGGSFHSLAPLGSQWAEAQSLQLFFQTFVVALVPLNIAAVILSGGLQTHGGYRYLMLSIFLPVFNLLLLLSTHYKRILEARLTTHVLLLPSIMIAVLFTANLSSFRERREEAYITPWEAKRYRTAFGMKNLTVQQVRDHVGVSDLALAQCIDDHKDAYGLVRGVAEFWDARSITLLSKKRLQVVNVNGDLTPQFGRLNSKDWFRVDDRGATREPLVYNFAVTSERLPPSVFRRQIQETASFSCPNAAENNLVLVYGMESGFSRNVIAAFQRFHDAIR